MRKRSILAYQLYPVPTYQGRESGAELIAFSKQRFTSIIEALDAQTDY